MVTLFNQSLKMKLRGKTCRLVTEFPGIRGVIQLKEKEDCSIWVQILESYLSVESDINEDI